MQIQPNPLPRICGCVVLYRPRAEDMKNVQSLCNNVEKLYVIDNTEKGFARIDPSEILNGMNRVELVRNHENLGIARALNQGAQRGLEEHFDFMLTMDQDTKVNDGYVEELFTVLNKNKIDLSKVGIVSSHLRVHSEGYNPDEGEFCDKLLVMTSGNLLNLAAFSKVGPFLNELFIDRVDCEYCLRLKSNGFRIIQVNTVSLDHSLGKITAHHFFNRSFYPTNHSALRRYYITRNTLYVVAKYRDQFPEYFRYERNIFRRELMMILLFEKGMFAKLKAIIKGYLDYKQHITGKHG